MSRVHFLLLVMALLVGGVACGDDAQARQEAPANNDAPNNDAPNNDAPNNDVNNDAPQEPQVPAVWGLEPLEDEDPAPGVVEVTLRARKQVVNFFGELDVDMLSYNNQLPGPLIQANVGDEVVVNFVNEMNRETTIHWHGLRISDQMDGNPRIQEPVQPGTRFVYRFKVEEAGTYWYHPHVRSHEQVEMGLYGMLIVHDPNDPQVDQERALAIDDILLTQDGIPPMLVAHHEQMHGRSGNILLINGAPEAISGQARQGQVERWRLVNTANARTMELSIRGASWRVIGTDGGRIDTPYEVERLLMAVGQRYDVEVVYDQPGPVELISHVLTLDDNNQVVEIEIPQLEIEVEASDEATAALDWSRTSAPSTRLPMRNEEIIFDARQTATGVEWSLNGQAHGGHGPLFTFEQGEVVKLKLRNNQGPEHPFHLHGQFFTIIDDGRPETAQPGFKDTVLVPGRSTVEIIAYFDNPGQWMAHCHILEHAALGMMSEIVVTPRN